MFAIYQTSRMRGQLRLAYGVTTVLLALALGLAPMQASGAEAAPGRDLASIQRWLRDRNPELAALALEAEAAQERVYPAGALPDPMVGLTLRGIDPSEPWRGPSSQAGNLLEVRQRFPLWGKRELARSQATHEADAVRHEAAARGRELLAQAEAAYVRYWEAAESIKVIDRRLVLLRQVEEIAGVRYALGMAPQQDAIRAQVAATALQSERLDREAMYREAVGMLNGLLGRAGDAPLETPTAVPELPLRYTSIEDAIAASVTASHPALAARDAMVRAAEDAERLQRRSRLPDVTLGIGAMEQRGGLDSLEFMVEVEIPLQRRARRAREREAGLRADAARLRETSTERELSGRLAGSLARWRAARARRELTERTLLVQADTNFRSALASYQTGEVDFATVLDALDAWQDAELSRLSSRRDEGLAAADVRAIEGVSP